MVNKQNSFIENILKEGLDKDIILDNHINEWKPSTVIVVGKLFNWNDLNSGKLYHGSRSELSVGDILEPQSVHNFKESEKNKISISSDYARSKYWAEQIKSDNSVYIYEIIPLSKIDIWRVSLAKMGTKFDLWEGRVTKAKIINKIII